MANPYEPPNTVSSRRARVGLAPICGILSIAAVPIACVVLFGIQLIVDAMGAQSAKPTILLVWLFCSVSLFVLTLALALVRRERHRWLTIVGIVCTLAFSTWLFLEA